MFLGITVLAAGFGVTPTEHQTVISQIGRHVFGNGLLFYLFQLATMVILVLAANTSFAGFPQLTSIMAKDGFCREAWRPGAIALCFPIALYC